VERVMRERGKERKEVAPESTFNLIFPLPAET